MGHEVGVTALQMAAAYSAIANDGFLMRPQFPADDSQLLGCRFEHIFPQKCRVVASASYQHEEGA